MNDQIISTNDLEQQVIELKVQNEMLRESVEVMSTYCIPPRPDRYPVGAELVSKAKAITNKTLAQSLAAHDKRVILDAVTKLRPESKDPIDDLIEYANVLEGE